MRSALERIAMASFTFARHESPAVVARAPARVELLGNHTDYNDGLVLAAAIDRFTVVVGCAIAPREGRARSLNFSEDDRFALDALEPGDPGSWGRYVRGVVWALQEARGPLAGGFDATIAGDVPLGAGLSSSASLQASLALFLIAADLVGQWRRAFTFSSCDRDWEEKAPAEPRPSSEVPTGSSGASPSHREQDGAEQGGRAGVDDPARMELARVLRRSENAFVGVQSGLLDQFSVLFGRAGYALRLDCRSLDYQRLPLGDPAPAIVVCDSKTSRRLADGMYNRRRTECDQVVASFRARRGEAAVASLRDISLDDLQDAWDNLDRVARRRARHVLTENERVRQGAEALLRGDPAGLGRLMSASHASSRDDFENSSPALDALVEAAESAPGFLGAKLSGAGWAGCTVNLVESAHADAFAEAVRMQYAKRMNIVPDIHICHAADGAFGRVPAG